MSSKSITCSLDETILNDTIEFLLICRFKTMSGEMLNISIFALLCRLSKHVLTMSQKIFSPRYLQVRFELHFDFAPGFVECKNQHEKPMHSRKALLLQNSSLKLLVKARVKTKYACRSKCRPLVLWMQDYFSLLEKSNKK